MKRLIVGVGLLALLHAASVQAQSITGNTLRIYFVGATQATTTTLLTGSFLCGQTPKIPAPTGTVQNAKRIIRDDPADATKDCIYVDAPGGPLLALPFGTQAYFATLTDTYGAAGPTPESLASNSFTRPGTVGPVPTGLRVVP